MKNKLTVAFILLGGGPKCASQVGAIKTLVPPLIKHGAEIKYFGSNSGGALNAVKFAEAQTPAELQKKAEELEEIWLNVEKQGPSSIFPLSKKSIIHFIRKGSFLDGNTLWELLDSPKFTTNPLDVNLVRNSPFALDIFAEEADTGKAVIFSKYDEAARKNPDVLKSYVVASASLQPLFPPVEINGKKYKDCGYFEYEPAMDWGCNTIFILLTRRYEGLENPPEDFFLKLIYGLLKPYRCAINKINHNQITSGLRLAEEINKRPGRKIFMKSPGLRFIPIYPDNPKTISTYSFAPGDISTLLKSPQKTAEDALKKIGINAF